MEHAGIGDCVLAAEIVYQSEHCAVKETKMAAARYASCIAGRFEVQDRHPDSICPMLFLT